MRRPKHLEITLFAMALHALLGIGLVLVLPPSYAWWVVSGAGAASFVSMGAITYLWRRHP